MKTAISIPDEIFRSAEQLAQRLRVSRSQLYSNAVADFVARHREQMVTERLNAVYETEGSSLDPVAATLQHRTLARRKK